MNSVPQLFCVDVTHRSSCGMLVIAHNHHHLHNQNQQINSETDIPIPSYTFLLLLLFLLPVDSFVCLSAGRRAAKDAAGIIVVVVIVDVINDDVSLTGPLT